MSALPSDHKTLVEQVTQGDEVALGELIARHLPTLEAFLRRRADKLVLAKESVSDLAQSVCREALNDAARFEYQGEGAFVRWFKTLALSKIVEKRRYYTAQKRDVGRDVDLGGAADRDSNKPSMGEVYATLVTPSRVVAGKEQMAKVAKAFDQLKKDYQDVIVLAKIWELPHKEIAHLMGRSEVATRSLLRKAIARLGVVVASST